MIGAWFVVAEHCPGFCAGSCSGFCRSGGSRDAVPTSLDMFASSTAPALSGQP